MNPIQRFLHKLLNWEYWPFYAVYYPLYPVWIYFGIRAKSMFFFSAANPTIKNGGMALESKMEIYNLIEERFIPKTILVSSEDNINVSKERAIEAGIFLPFIVKPDIGMKAYGVAIIRDWQVFEKYQQKIGKDFLIQELILFPNEIGIFYVRIPEQPKGTITGIVSKEFLSVTGNGVDSIFKLIHQSPRSSFQIDELKKIHGENLHKILPVNDSFVLVPFGSHTRGSKFLDITSMQNEILLQTINNICKEIPGFYFGRLDIRYDNFKDLCEGKHFSIIEINGAGSEPTHIYDPSHSIFFAWKEIIRHWKLLCRVSIANHKNGQPYISFAEGIEMMRANKLLEAELKEI